MLDQSLLDHFVKSLNLSKKQSAGAGKFLSDFGLLQEKTKWADYYLHRETEVKDYFEDLDDETSYCKNIGHLIEDFFGIKYEASEYRLFVDSGKGSFKMVLLNNENRIKSIPVFYSKTYTENQDHVEEALNLIKYYDKINEWLIVCDLKMIGILLGIKVGNCQYPCFLCNWRQDTSRNQDKTSSKSYIRQPGIERESFLDGQFGVKGRQLVLKEKILFPPLHIKLGIFSQFIQSLGKDHPAVNYLKTRFPLSAAKIEGGILNGSQINKVMNKTDIQQHLKGKELRAWHSFMDLCHMFLGNLIFPQIIKQIIKTSNLFS